MKRTTAIVALLSVLSLCGSISAGASSYHSKAISKKAAGKQYLRIFGPTGSAASTFGTEAGAWTSSTTDAQAEADAKPLITALQTLNRALLKDSWPAGARSDAKAVVRSDKPLIRDLQSLSNLDRSSISSYVATFDKDANAFGTAATNLQQDLGLSAPTG
jgi:hypothetical protein